MYNKFVWFMLFVLIGSMLQTAAFAQSGQNFDEYLVAQWDFDEGAGDTVHDSSPNKINGTIKNALQWSYGRNIYGLSGAYSSTVRSYVDLGTDSLIPHLDKAKQITFSGWVNRAHTAGTYSQRIFTNIINAGNAGLEIYFNSTRLVIAARDTASCPWTSSEYSFTTTNSWVHLTVIFDFENKKVDVYYDGEKQPSTKEGNFAGNFTVGHYDIGTPTHPSTLMGISNSNVTFSGTVDSFRLYKTALSEEKINELAGEVPQAANCYAEDLVARWVFNESSGDAIDTSGNSIHGTITGATFDAEKGLFFDGTAANKVVLPANVIGSKLQDAEHITITFRAQKTDTGSGPFRILWIHGHAASSSIEIQMTSNKLGVAARTYNSTTGQIATYKSNSFDYDDDKANPNQIAITFDFKNKVVKAYSNGNELSATNNFNSDSFPYDFYNQGTATRTDFIGNNNSSSYKGYLDDIRIYRRLLSQDELEEIAAPTLSFAKPDLTVESNILTVQTDVVNTTTKTASKQLVVAKYTDDVLTGVQVHKLDIPAECRMLVSKNLDLTPGETAKAFIWDAISSVRPAVPVGELQ
ncbi:MAG: hypothetical protein PHF89_05465 [Eubacteriales bacterium]|nr:hypothetical protein [Eubacteriales bacterium]